MAAPPPNIKTQLVDALKYKVTPVLDKVYKWGEKNLQDQQEINTALINVLPGALRPVPVAGAAAAPGAAGAAAAAAGAGAAAAGAGAAAAPVAVPSPAPVPVNSQQYEAYHAKYINMIMMNEASSHLIAGAGARFNGAIGLGAGNGGHSSTLNATKAAIAEWFTALSISTVEWPVRPTPAAVTAAIAIAEDQADVNTYVTNQRVCYGSCPKEAAFYAVQYAFYFDCIIDIIATKETYQEQYLAILKVADQMHLERPLPPAITVAIQAVWDARNVAAAPWAIVRGAGHAITPAEGDVFNAIDNPPGTPNPLENHILAAAYTAPMNTPDKENARLAFIEAAVSQLSKVDKGLTPVRVIDGAFQIPQLDAIRAIPSVIKYEDLRELADQQFIASIAQKAAENAILALHNAINQWEISHPAAGADYILTRDIILDGQIVPNAANVAKTILSNIKGSVYIGGAGAPAPSAIADATGINANDYKDIVRSGTSVAVPVPTAGVGANTPRDRGTSLEVRLTNYLGIAIDTAAGAGGNNFPPIDFNSGNARPLTRVRQWPGGVATNLNIYYAMPEVRIREIVQYGAGNALTGGALHALLQANIVNLTAVQKRQKKSRANELHDLNVDLLARALVFYYRCSKLKFSSASPTGAIRFQGGGSFEAVQAMQEEEQEQEQEEQEGGQQEQEEQPEKQEPEKQEQEEQPEEQDGGKKGKTKRSPKSKPLRRSKKAARTVGAL